MRVASLLLVVVCPFVCSPPAVDAADATGWLSDFESAEALAKSKQATLLIHFHAAWCGPCRQMESNVLNTAEVLSALKSGVVAVKVNCDQQRDLVQRFGIRSLPSDVFVSSSGQVLGRRSGYSGKHSYVAAVDRFRSKADRPANAVRVQNQIAVARPSSSGLNSVPVAARRTDPRPSAAQSSPALPPASTRIAKTVSLQQTTETGSATAGRMDPSGVVAAASVQPRAAASLHDAVRPWRTKRLGLSGYCPVSLAENLAWQAGGVTYEAEIDGVCYRLRSAAILQQFKQNPEKFFPALHGYDAVAFRDSQTRRAGAIELGVRYRGRLFFFSSVGNRDRFLKNPNPYADLALGTPELLSTALDSHSGR